MMDDVVVVAEGMEGPVDGGLCTRPEADMGLLLVLYPGWDARLSSLSVPQCSSLVPVFHPDVYHYECEIPFHVANVSIAATAVWNTSVVMVCAQTMLFTTKR